MVASKENAAKARRFADDLDNPEVVLPQHGRRERITFIRDFLEAAERKLPRASAYVADRQRRKARQTA